jgi:hypothetical protein
MTGGSTEVLPESEKSETTEYKCTWEVIQEQPKKTPYKVVLKEF